MSLLNRKYLFVHINKSGGGVVTTNMSKNGKTEIKNFHRSLENMLNIAKNKYNIEPKNLFIFTIVRNPWDRMVSMFFFYRYKYNAPEFFSGDSKIDDDFKAWIRFIYSDRFDKTKTHSKVNIFKYCFSNQLNWLCDNNDNMLKIDKIIKFEDNCLEDLFKNYLNLQVYDVKTRIHPTKHKHYSEYYDDETMLLVKKHYLKDIEYFGYVYK